MASVAMEGMWGILADRLDLSDEELVRLQKTLNEYLNPKEESDGGKEEKGRGE